MDSSRSFGRTYRSHPEGTSSPLHAAYNSSFRRFGTTYRPHLQGQAVHRSSNLEYGTDRLSRNFGKYQSTVGNIPEERRSQVQCYIRRIQLLYWVGGSTYEPSRIRSTYCVSEYGNTTLRFQLHAHSVLVCSNWSLLYTAARLDIPPVLINSSELVPLGTRMF